MKIFVTYWDKYTEYEDIVDLRHQDTVWSNVDLSSGKYIDIILRAILQEIPNPAIHRVTSLFVHESLNILAGTILFISGLTLCYLISKKND